MYNKLFTKILDSSIWMEDTPTRLVWITLLATMDEDGLCQYASVANLAHRARVTPEEAEKAVACLEAEDHDSSDPDHGGRRIERIPGGWMVLNAVKYRQLVTREVAKEKIRERVARHRERKRAAEHPVTPCNGAVTVKKRRVTPSETDTETKAEAETPPPADLPPSPPEPPGEPGVSERGAKFADWFKTLLPPDIILARNWQAAWGKCYDDLIRLDHRTPEQIAAVCKWARADSFWSSNFLTPLKLRQRKKAGEPLYFDTFAERMKTPGRDESGAQRKARKSAGEYALKPGEGPLCYDPMTDTYSR